MKEKVSFYQSQGNKPTVQTTANGIDTYFTTIIKNISKGVYKNQVEALRKLNKEDYDRQKVFLPAFTPSGTFSERKNAGLKSHSGILSIDIDKVESEAVLNDLKDASTLDPFVIAVFTSPSGKGLKIFVRIAPDKHAESFIHLQSYYETFLGAVIDNHCKDVSRLCFVSHDPEAFINTEAVEYKIPMVEPERNLLFEVEEITKRIEAAGKDITQGYENWLNLGFSLSQLGEPGRGLFLRLSTFNPQFDESRANRQFDECLKNRKQGRTIKTFFYLAKSNGININIEDFPPSVSSKHDEFKKPGSTKKYGEEISDLERIEIAINEMNNIRFNSIRECIEIKSKSDENELHFKETNAVNIWRQLQYRRIKNASKATIDNILASDFVPEYNPYIDYFSSLPDYDKNKEPDYIQLLCDMVFLKDEKRDRSRFNIQFKKALVRCIACSVWDNGINNLNFNKHCLVFINPDQSIGKSSFIRCLVPRKLELYFSEKMPFGNSRDEDYTMQSSFIINIDELADIEGPNLLKVKTALSRGTINVRRMNTQRRMQDARRCNFWATTNETSFLKDDTGSVRWICFEVKAFDSPKRFWEPDSPHFINMDNVWKQAFALYRNGFSFHLSTDEQRENEAANENYKGVNVEFELVNMCLKPAPKEKEYFMQATEIKALICTKYPHANNSINVNRLGSVLKRSGFNEGQEYFANKGFQLKGYYVQDAK